MLRRDKFNNRSRPIGLFLWSSVLFVKIKVIKGADLVSDFLLLQYLIAPLNHSRIVALNQLILNAP